jgi:crotonobetainyl-CoA:carnitine CoA-transferase CaiB-like acyl-CoA transferase
MRVLDLSYANFSGIIAGTFFGEAGAEVIRIEPPQGDPARVMSPYGVKSNPAPLSQDSLLLPF